MRSNFLLIIIALFTHHCLAAPVALFYYTSDTHGRYDPDRLQKEIIYLETLKQEAKSKNIPLIILHNGDFYTGSSDLNGHYDALIYKIYGLNVATVGNHEFDCKKCFKNMMDILGKETFISSNINWISRPGPDDHTFEFRPFRYIEINEDTKIAIVGVTDRNTQVTSGSSFSKEFTFSDPFESVSNVIHNLRVRDDFQGTIILQSHQGYYEDIALYEKLENFFIKQNIKGIDVILGGHTHMKKHETIGTTLKIPIIQPGAYRDSLSRFELDLTDGRLGLKNFSRTPHSAVSKIPPSYFFNFASYVEATNIIGQWGEKHKEKIISLSKKYGFGNETFLSVPTSEFELIPRAYAPDLRDDDFFKTQLSLDEFIAEAFLQYGISKFADSKEFINLGLSMRGAIRNILRPVGVDNYFHIDIEDIDEILPFHEKMTMVTFSFSQFLDYVEKLLAINKTAPAKGSAFSPTSGIDLEVLSRSSVDLKSFFEKKFSSLSNFPTDQLKIRVFMPKYFADGGDHYPNLKDNLSSRLSYQFSNSDTDTDLSVVSQFIRQIGSNIGSDRSSMMRTLELNRIKNSYRLPCAYFAMPLI
ncbi:MAG: metallophosphoesterase [Bacteriovoracaceae bacterium]|nr:metallophosphoesterase [Bacteriovoracaceae bacterium]